MRKLFYLLFLLPLVGLAQNATITSTGTTTSVTKFNGGVWADRILKTPVVDTASLFPNIANLGRVLTYNNRLYHHNGTYYKKLAYASDYELPSLQDVIEVNPYATYADEVRITSGAGTIFTEFSLSPTVSALTHSSAANFSQIALSNHFVGLSAVDNQLSINPDSASINSAFGVGAPVNPGDAVRLSDLEAATTGTFVPLGGTTTPVTGNIEFVEGAYIQNTSDGINRLFLNDNTVGLLSYNPGTEYTTTLQLSGGSGSEIASDNPTFVGIEYGADYSANYTSRSLVDKGYVDGLAGIPLSGTVSGSPVTGNIEFQNNKGLDFGHTGDGYGYNGRVYGEDNNIFLLIDNYTDSSVSYLTLNTAGINIGGDSADLKGIYSVSDFSAVDPTNKLIYAQRQYVDDAVAAAGGGSQTLDQTLTNGSTTGQSITFTDTGSPAGLNGSTAGFVKFSGGNLLVGSNSTSSKVTTFKDHGIELGSAITDGIKGLADYSANYTANSFVQHDWVLSQIPATSSFLVKANNLSDLTNAGTARTNLGLTTLATTTPGTNVATFLTTPTSANLAAAVTDETGSGALVFGTSPTFTTSITTPIVAPAATSGSTVGTTSLPYENVYAQNVYRPTGAMMIGTQASNSLGFATNNVSRWSIASGGAFAPVTNNTYTFGTSTLRPSIGYFVALDCTGQVTVATPTASDSATTKAYVDAGAYGYAVNAATTGLSSATLNSTYPNVPVGYRVICGSITLGGAIYTKYSEAGSSDVWLMCSAPVQP